MTYAGKSFAIISNSNLVNKVSVIKAIRELTFLGLKEAKDASEVCASQILYFHASIDQKSNPEYFVEEQFKILRANGVKVGSPVHDILEDLRNLATDALKIEEDELANDILQLVLAEKLRRKPNA